MQAIIDKIDYPKSSRNGDGSFIRVYFKLENGAWAATDLVTSYRNFRRWEPILKLGRGTRIEGISLKSPNKVDADSIVKVISHKQQLPIL